MSNTVIDESCEEYEYDCDVLGAKTHLLITRTIERVTEPVWHIEHGPSFNCKNVTRCGIAKSTLQPDQWNVDWEACPGLRSFREKGHL